jgi:maltose/moltooligosaccharide transporter
MKLNTKRTVFVGLAFMSICAFWQLYDAIIPLILKNSFHVGDTLSGAIMALDNVFALFLLPFFGVLSDKTNTRFGRRIPFIVCGTAAAVISMLLIPIADDFGSLLLFGASLLLVLLSMSTYRSPAVALMPDVTPKPLRSKANAVINLMGAVGGMLTLLLISLLVPKSGRPDYLPLFAVVAGIMAVSVILLVLKINERKITEELSVQEPREEPLLDARGKPAPMEKEVKRSLLFILLSVSLWFMGYNAITTAFSKYAQVYWGLKGGGFANCLLVATGAAILSYIPVGSIATRFGRKKTILFGVGILAICFTLGSFIKTFSPLVNVLFVFVGIAWAAINVNSYPMVVEMSRGTDVGKFTGLYYSFSMAAQVLTPILSGALLEHVGYGTLFPYAAFFVTLSFLTMLFVKHGDSKPIQPKSKLEVFNIED